MFPPLPHFFLFRRRALFVALGLAALTATSAAAQWTNFPVYSLPASGDAPQTWFGAGFGRGLNEDSGKQNAFGAVVGMTGLGGSISAAVGAAMVNYDPDAKYSFAGAAAVDMLPNVAVQAGIGYISTATDVSTMNFPIGVALRTTAPAGSATVAPWVMPRIHLARVSAFGTSTTNTDFGVSGGATLMTTGGFGVHAAIDLMATDPSVWTIGAGVHYIMP